MATKYYAVLTNVGAAKLAKATALGAQVEITQMAVGDGNGALPTPNPAQTALVHELRRAPLNTLSIDQNNANQIIAEQVIPEEVGGWWIREIGLFDEDGDMIAVANCAETYKPQLQEGSGRVQIVRMILIVSSTAAVTLKIDPSVVLATRAYVDSQIISAKSYADDLMGTHLASENPHDQYPLIANALKEMADAGLVDEVLKNLRLGAGAPAIGIPFFWPLAAMPNTVMDEWENMVFLKHNGASFSAAEYPKLAKVWTGLVIPDMRGEFPRIWDDGRGVDSGRGLLTSQAQAVQRHSHDISMAYGTSASGTKDVLGQSPNSDLIPIKGMNGATIFTGNGNFYLIDNSTTTAETRPRNIAFNFLVRAK
ncbi:phage tail protein [Citrobacter amalonaticus]|uniref:phage tail-collar fiber domain-containing protein n=1 Tax=Citrobacter TaxID=544 RepID=UPI002580A0B8|nr:MULTISPECIES: phage tail protein [Citrobacter]MDM3519509.1 phage tail protein [Citrobacter sp. Ca225]MDV2139610.1 phage tail protein [Citrobacter amalonaticus]MEB0587117.1 phage tail protein [Citrobacter amalonaticus]